MIVLNKVAVHQDG